MARIPANIALSAAIHGILRVRRISPTAATFPSMMTGTKSFRSAPGKRAAQFPMDFPQSTRPKTVNHVVNVDRTHIMHTLNPTRNLLILALLGSMIGAIMTSSLQKLSVAFRTIRPVHATRDFTGPPTRIQQQYFSGWQRLKSKSLRARYSTAGLFNSQFRSGLRFAPPERNFMVRL